MPKISVIIPTYNLYKMIPETIKSVLVQTERDLEVIVVDDGSTDGTRSVINSISDKRVRYFYKENGGVSSARNYGLERAEGQYVAFLDHDDLWPANYLKVMMGALEKQDEFGLAYSRITVMYPEGRLVRSYKACEGKSGWMSEDLFRNGFIWTSAAVMSKLVLEDFYFDESLKRSYEDSDFFLRLSARTPFLFVRDVEAIRREHAQNLSVQVGVLPTKILILERFYFTLGGDNLVPAKVAKRRISHTYRKVAETHRGNADRSAALFLYKCAIRYWPSDVRLYIGLGKSWLLSKKNDHTPNWQMPGPLSAIRAQTSKYGK